MIRVLFYTFFSVLLVIFTGGCKRSQKDGILGPDLKVASSSFSIIEPFKIHGNETVTDTININFEKVESRKSTYFYKIERDTILFGLKPRPTYFTAKFNESVKWRIEISQSNPYPFGSPFKLISGTSDQINNVIPEWTWDGSSDNEFYFGKGKVNITFSILGFKDTLRVSNKFLISGMPQDTASTGVILNDFEGGSGVITYGDNKDKIPNPLPAILIGLPLTPQGTKSLLLSGTDHNGDYFVGGYQEPLRKGTLKSHKASDVYINVYIYGFPKSAGLTPNATKIGIGVSQDNDGNGAFDPTTEDTFDQQIAVDWEGWRLISVKYSNLKRSTAMLEGGSGPNLFKPETAVSISCNILASPNGSTVGAALDYLVITYGKPLK